MRLGGLASGMDTDSMVDQLMKAQNMKVERVEAEKQVKEWQKESLNGLNKDFANFILDAKRDLDYNTQGNPGNLDWVRGASSSDESVGTAVAGKGALEGKHEIVVEKLAKGVTGVSKSKIEDGVINTWEDNRVDFKFKINEGKEINISKDDSIADIAKKINDSGAGVKANYDKKLGAFFLTTIGEGENSGIDIKPISTEDSSGLNNFLKTIQLEVSNGEETKELYSDGTVNSMKGKNGSIKYNGFTTSIESNSFTFNEITFNAKIEGTFTVNVTTDADAIVDKVKKFVDDYNKIIEQAGKLTNEKQDKNFKPLTDEQREAMSEKEIEKWEEKAKSGLLRGDADVEKALSSLRLGLYEELDTDGPFKFITDIGISTQKYSSGGVGGLLEINEDKLRAAISQDTDAVVDILFKNGDREAEITKRDGTTKKGTDKGMINRIFDDLTAGMKNLIAKSGPGDEAVLFRKVKSNIMTDFVSKGGRYSGKGSISDLDDDMLNFDKKISKLKEQLARKEQMYFSQFAAMEKAMQKANSQGDWLMQQTQM